MSQTTAALLTLALAGGMLDAASYLGLGRVFTANMTGNTVLLAVALVRGSGGDATRAAVALGGFAVGVALGVAALKPSEQAWPRLATGTLLLESLALGLALAGWVVARESLRFELIALSALAMGLQSAVVRGSHVGGVNTTYVTGTLTNAIARLVDRWRGQREGPQGPSLPGATWMIYGAGAVAGGLVEQAWRAAAIALVLAAVGGVIAFGGAWPRTQEG